MKNGELIMSPLKFIKFSVVKKPCIINSSLNFLDRGEFQHGIGSFSPYGLQHEGICKSISRPSSLDREVK